MKKITAKELSIEEKLKLFLGKNFWQNNDLDGKLPLLTMSDGPVGIRHPLDLFSGEKDTVRSLAYPSTHTLANTWNKELAYFMGKAIANDAIDQNIDIILGPGVNIKRLPINGRNFEYYSEDPYLAGILAYHYIKGVQDQHIGTCIKHFAVNSSEERRHFKSMDIDEETLHNIYLKVFEIAFKANPWTIMCSYNLVNEIRMSENKQLYSYIRKEFGFEGVIVSDWFAVKNPAKSVNAGMNIQMPFEQYRYEQLLESYNNGEVDVDALTKDNEQLLDLLYKNEQEKRLRKNTLSLKEREKIALQIATEGIVLLKNKDNILPLKAKSKVYIFGSAAYKNYCGGGSSKVEPLYDFQDLRSCLAENGLEAIQDYGFDDGGLLTRVEFLNPNLEIINKSDALIINIGEDHNAVTEGANKESIRLNATVERLINDFKKYHKPIIVIMHCAGAIDVSRFIDSVDALLFAGYGGEFVSRAVANVLLGNANPSGRLSETFPIHLEDVLAMNSYSDFDKDKYEEKEYIGYRYFTTFDKEVMFPFGYGLSYSNFIYSNLMIKKQEKNIIVSFDIQNNSAIDGYEVPQLYLQYLGTHGEPKLILKEFTKILISAREIKTIEFCLDQETFSRYLLSKHSQTIRHGEYIIYIGKNCKELVLQDKIKY